MLRSQLWVFRQMYYPGYKRGKGWRTSCCQRYLVAAFLNFCPFFRKTLSMEMLFAPQLRYTVRAQSSGREEGSQGMEVLVKHLSG